MTNSHKNVINPFLESSTLLIMTFPEIVESKDRLWGRTCAVDNVRARRKGVRGKLYEIQISPERGLRNSLNFPSYFGMEYAWPWNMGKKLLEDRKLAIYGDGIAYGSGTTLRTHLCARGKRGKAYGRDAPRRIRETVCVKDGDFPCLFLEATPGYLKFSLFFFFIRKSGIVYCMDPRIWRCFT